MDEESSREQRRRREEQVAANKTRIDATKRQVRSSYNISWREGVIRNIRLKFCILFANFKHQRSKYCVFRAGRKKLMRSNSTQLLQK